jgi:RIO-like serine/threonine protein kinase
LISDANNGLFHLYHPDLGNHNLLVDDNYNILTLIDWEGACALPSEYSAVHPMWLRVLPEVFWRGNRFKKRWEEKGPLDQQKHQIFKDAVLAAETENGQAWGII